MKQTPLTPRTQALIRAQLHQWQKIALLPEEQKACDEKVPFITISREFGCPAYPLAVDLATTLKARGLTSGIQVFDRKLIEEISEREDISADLIKSLTSRTRNELEDWLVGLMAGSPSEISLFRKLARTIAALANRGDVILVGRGGVLLTRHLPWGIHVRLVARREWRVRSFRERFPDRAQEANEATIAQYDQEKEAFVNKYLQGDLTDPHHYDLVLNAEQVDPSLQVDLIAALYAKKVALHMRQG